MNDFGFSGVDTITEVKNVENVKNKDCEETLNKIEELILPLLEGLYDTRENAYIKWPNRGEVLEEKIKEFKKLTRKYKEQ